MGWVILEWREEVRLGIARGCSPWSRVAGLSRVAGRTKMEWSRREGPIVAEVVENAFTDCLLCFATAIERTRIRIWSSAVNAKGTCASLNMHYGRRLNISSLQVSGGQPESIATTYLFACTDGRYWKRPRQSTKIKVHQKQRAQGKESKGPANEAGISRQTKREWECFTSRILCRATRKSSGRCCRGLAIEWLERCLQQAQSLCCIRCTPCLLGS